MVLHAVTIATYSYVLLYQYTRASAQEWADRVRAFNSVKNLNLPPILKIVTRTVHAA